jgi:hypothetical protein
LSRDSIAGYVQTVRSAVQHLPLLAVDHREVTELLHGRPVSRSRTATTGEMAAFDPGGELVAIVALRDGKLWPSRVFVSQ